MIATVQDPVEQPPQARVAVIVPAYGVAHLVGEALTSLQRQTLTDWECVVIDDGSPDDVASAVAPFLADPRIRFLATDNSGVSTARNRAIAASNAPLVALLDGDDLFRPRYLETMVRVLEDDPEVRFATCNARMFGAVDRERTCVETRQGRGDGTRGSLSDVLDRSFNVYIGTTFRRVDFDAIGGFDRTMTQSEDFDLWVRLLMLGGEAHYVDQVLGDYRVRSGSASSNAGRMLLGNTRVYEKALASLPPDCPERELVRSLLSDSRAELSFERAMDRIIDGDTQGGLSELREVVRAGGMVRGPIWRLAFAFWQVFPSWARPMLRWRRRAHSRGAVASSGMFPSFLEIEG